MRRPTRWLFLVSLLAACQFSENRYATRTMRADELVGTWTATDFAIKSLRDVGHTQHLNRSDHEFTLRADGTCRIKTVFNVALTRGSDPEYRVYESGCRWQLGDVGHQALVLDLAPEPAGGQPYYYFAEERGRVFIWQYTTDPDAHRYLEFQRNSGGA
jgi:hypothetical protein